MNKTISNNVVRGIVLAIFSLLVVPIASAVAAGQDAPPAKAALARDTAEAHLKIANEAFASKKFDIAKDEAKRALKLEKNSPAAHVMFARVYREQGKSKEAIKSVTEAIRHRQNYAYAHYLLAILIYERNEPENFEQSAKEIDLAISQGITYSSAFALKGTLSIAAGKLETGLENYKKAREVISPNDPELPMLQEQIAALESYMAFKTPKDDPSYKRPQALNAPLPNYTEEARNKNIQGVVKAKIFVDERGEVKSILLISRLGYGLDEEAVMAVRKLKFTPATKDGKPTPHWMEIQIEFSRK